MDAQSVNYIDPGQNQASNGFSSIMNGGMTSVSNLTELGQARGQLLSIKLDQASSESVISNASNGQKFDKEGYMTDLNSLQFNQVHEIK